MGAGSYRNCLGEREGCIKKGKEGYRLSVGGHVAGGCGVGPDEVWSVKSRSSDIILR